jgi:glycosyltransferase involved in cell wall biosynthesis
MCKLSICIATYNGDKYVRQQIESIQPQLSGHDEIIISDDSSTDRTIEIIEDINDSRIRLFKNSFKSPIYNFEYCFTKATGDIIFISDQDDLWLPNKVATICTVFQDNPSITLVASDAQIIDENGEIVVNTFYSDHMKFTSKVIPIIIKNRFLGCTLAFRRSILEVLLPFPSHLPMHDSWIGIINQLYGRVHFINTPLISYRRHSQNFSSSTHSSLLQMIKWRLRLTIAVIGRVWKYKGRKFVI